LNLCAESRRHLACTPHLLMARILLVDDEADFRELLAAILTEEGHDVMTAPEGLAAAQSYERHRPDLVITDLELPELPGLAVISCLRGLCPEAKIIAMSGNDQALDMARMLRVSAVLCKPVQVSHVIATVRSNLRDDQRKIA
jgi:DNA-binding response OmpR family regulator